MLKLTRGKTGRARLVAATVGTALGLAACGGGGGDAGSNRPAAIDPFFLLVAAVIAVSPEDAEPRNIDAISPTSPENTEPTPL